MGVEGERFHGLPTLQSRNCRVAILLQTKSAVLFSVVVEPRKAATDKKKRLPGPGEGKKERRGAGGIGRETTRAQRSLGKDDPREE